MRTVKLLGKLFAYRPGLYAANQLSWLAASLLSLLTGLAARQIFNQLSGASAGLNVWSLVALFATLSCSQAVVGFSGINAHVRHAFVTCSLLRRNLLAGMMRQPGAALGQSVGEALSVFRDDVGQVDDALDWTIDFTCSLIRSAVALMIMVAINARLTAFVLLPLLAISTLINRATDGIQRYRQTSRIATSRVTDALGEVLGAVQAVQLAGAEEAVIAHIERLNQQRQRAVLSDRAVNLLLRALMAVTSSAGMGLVLLFAGQSMRFGGFSVGDFALFAAYVDLFSHFNRDLGEFLANLKQTEVSIGRMEALMHGDLAELVAANPLPIFQEANVESLQLLDTPGQRLEQLQSLSVEGLCYHHAGTGRGIDDVNLQIERGSFTVIVGQVGSGKSTLLRCLLGLLPQEQGVVRWNGEIIVCAAETLLPPHVAYTGQVPTLFSQSIRENISLGQALSPHEIDQAIYQAVLEQDVQTLERGLETLVGPRGVRLSGGQVQRVAAARMFARQTELLVIDDLSSALDVQTEGQLWERLAAAGRTCLVVSHRQAALRRADRIIMMRDGKIEDMGSLSELLDRSQAMRQLWSGQIA